MASSSKPAKPGNRWNFISQAVASVEKGLDSILLEEDEKPKKGLSQQVVQKDDSSSGRPSTEQETSSSSNNAKASNDRLQARLAQAMAKKNSIGSSPSGTAASQPTADTLTPPPERVVDTHLVSPDLPLTTDASVQNPKSDVDEQETIQEPQVVASDTSKVSSDQGRRRSKDETRSARPPLTQASGLLSSQSPRTSGDLGLSRTSSQGQSDPDAALLNAQLEHESKQSELQEEINGYLERIDALQRNVNMLAKQTLQNAKDIATDDEKTVHEKQLAEKDEKIAVLIEEGTKLTKSELNYRNMIKKLRAQNVTLARDQDAVRQRAEKAEKTLSSIESRATKAETDSRRKDQQISVLTKSAGDIEAITRERNALNTTLADIRSQLGVMKRRAEETEADVKTKQANTERRLRAEHQDDLNSAKLERQLAEDKLKHEIDDTKQSLLREKEHSKQMETEMLAEQAALESRLESFRVRAEEATSGDTSELQAKLLRQIETLQQQYAAASQNWQGIEGTLLARITTLEKERDIARTQEADLKRKLRDATTKARTAARQLEDTQHTLHTLEDKQADLDLSTRQLTRKNEELEETLTSLQAEFDSHKARAEHDLVRRLEEERSKWIASLPPPVNTDRLDSPIVSTRKGHSKFDSLMSPTDRPISTRRSSNQPSFQADGSGQASKRTDLSILARTNGNHSSANRGAPETPSIVYSVDPDQDDFFGINSPTRHSITPTNDHSLGHSRTRDLNEFMSASTLNTGPSIALVERLSTTVRRLESEKAASKDELSRLTTQRDEARSEVVNLMREVESTRSTGDKLTSLQADHKILAQKHQAMLELLGEKTEQVDELKADVADVKAMYRELVDTLGRDK